MPRDGKIIAAVLLGTVTLLAWAMGPPAQAETITGSIMWGGLTRTYRLHVPATYDQSRPMPLVIALHGGGGTGARMEKLTLDGFNTLGDKEGFLVVYPDGIENHWNDGRATVKYRTIRDKVDDVGFISALIDHLVQERQVDKNRVYVTGISNGAMMSFRLACELTGKIAAIAAVSGNLPYDLAPHCAPARPISVLMINGTADPLMPYGGGEVGAKRVKVGKVLSVAQTVKFWTAHNQCSPTPAVTGEPPRNPRDGTRVRKEVYSGGQEGTEVILYTIEGGGHSWPKGHQYLPEFFVGKTSQNLDATEAIWNFFKRQGRK
jgi:polyhydroxybutyrate depolymerase